MAKDLFSEHATDYAKFRPTYPPDLVEYIVSFVDQKETAWDAATGNGQAALLLATHFKKVFATDLSEGQIEAAQAHPGIQYSVAAAESTRFADNSFDLITIAQAYHWINHKNFSEEAKRVGKQNAIVAVWGYNLFRCSNKLVTNLVDEFYHDVTDPYWEPERKYLEKNYLETPFYFEEIPVKSSFKMQTLWTIDQMAGYINTWSAIKKFTKLNGYNPVEKLMQKVKEIWGNEPMLQFDFPLALRMGRIRKELRDGQ